MIRRWRRLAIRCTHCCRRLQPLSRWSGPRRFFIAVQAVILL